MLYFFVVSCDLGFVFGIMFFLIYVLLIFNGFLLQKNAMDAGEMGLIGEQFDPSVVGRIREEEFESRSGSDNVEGASGDDREANEDGPPRKKKYHRHTPHQIQELESYGFQYFLLKFYVFVLCIQ